MDLFATNAFRSGKIAAYVELRDKTLVQAQAQLDQFAAALSSALSDRTIAGIAGDVAAAADRISISILSGLQNGNVVQLTYTDNTTSLRSNAVDRPCRRSVGAAAVRTTPPTIRTIR